MNDFVLAWAGAVLGFVGTVWVLSLFVGLSGALVITLSASAIHNTALHNLRMLRK